MEKITTDFGGAKTCGILRLSVLRLFSFLESSDFSLVQIGIILARFVAENDTIDEPVGDRVFGPIWPVLVAAESLYDQLELFIS